MNYAKDEKGPAGPGISGGEGLKHRGPEGVSERPLWLPRPPTCVRWRKRPPDLQGQGLFGWRRDWTGVKSMSEVPAVVQMTDMEVWPQLLPTETAYRDLLGAEA